MGTVSKELPHSPASLAMIPLATGMPSQVTVMPVSEAPKPVPNTVTSTPAAPLAGKTVIRGFMVKVEFDDEAAATVEFDEEAWVTSTRKTRYVPPAAAGMVKEALTLFPEAVPDLRTVP